MNPAEQPSNLKAYFEQALFDALHNRVGLPKLPDVDNYLVNLMTGFLREDSLFAIRDGHGKPVRRIVDMLEYGDVRLKASSFEQERFVHRHIGNLLLFTSGMMPEFLPKLGLEPIGKLMSTSSWLDPTHRGSESYRLASLFDYDPFSSEARVLKTLSLHFADYQYGFGILRESFGGLGWGILN